MPTFQYVNYRGRRAGRSRGRLSYSLIREVSSDRQVNHPSVTMPESLCEPLLQRAWDCLYYTWKYLSKPFRSASKTFWNLENSGLYFCGFSIILVPLTVAFWSSLLAILLVELCVLAAIGLVIGLFFISVGIWPAFIIAFGTTSITIFRLPWNIYYHCLVTYRTVMLRGGLKITSFFLLPIVHLLIPPFTLVVCLLTHVPWFISISFFGYPMKPWSKIKPFHEKFWKKLVTDLKRFSENFGHPSGIPQDWDGKVYGLPIDPIAVIISIFLYCFSVVPISLGSFLIFSLKSIPIFLGTLVAFWKTMNIGAALQWYKGVLHGIQLPQQPTSERIGINQDERSGHTGWTKPLKKATKGAKKFIEGYAKIKICTVYSEKIANHATRLKHLHPKKLFKLIRNYKEDFSPLKLVPENAGIAWLIIWIPLLFSSILWALGLFLVLTVPPLTFLLGFLAWVACWIPVLLGLPLLYLAGWIFIIFGLPSLYILLWALILVGPWVLSILGALAGPVLALKIPLDMLYNNFYNPVEMWSGIKRSLLEVPDMLKRLDKWTASLALSRFRFCNSNPRSKKGNSEKVHINYWDLFIDRCKMEACRSQDLGWFSEDDIQAASPTAMIAIPGVAIVAILTDSIKKNKKDKTLVFWNEDATCTDTSRDMTDNVANVFWPQVMQVKAGLFGMHHLDTAATWVSLYFVSMRLINRIQQLLTKKLFRCQPVYVTVRMKRVNSWRRH